MTTTTDDAPSAARAPFIPQALGYTTLGYIALVGGYITYATGHGASGTVNTMARFALPVAAVAFIVAWGVVWIDHHTDQRVGALEVAVAANAAAIGELRATVGELRATVKLLAAARPAGAQRHRKRPRDTRPAATPGPAVLSPIDEMELRGFLRGALDRKERDD